MILLSSHGACRCLLMVAMKIFTLRIKIVLAVLACLVVLQGALLYQNNTINKQAKSWVLHSYQIIGSLRALNNHIKDIEMTHYYILAQKNNANGKAIPNTNSIDNSINQVRELTLDNPEHQVNLKNLQSMISQELKMFDDPLSLQQFPLMRAKIESKVLSMIQMEERLLEDRKIKDENLENLFTMMFLISNFLTYVMLVILFYMLFKTVKRLKESEQRLSRAVKGTSDGLWDWNPATNHIYFSPRVGEMLGYAPGEWNESLDAFNELIHPDDFDAVWDAVRTHLADGQQFNIEFQIRKHNGAYMWLQARGLAVWNGNNKPVRMSGFFTDITQAKVSEKLKNEFISTLSHELRTPLTSMRGSLGLLISGVGGEINEKAKNLLTIANKNCERLINIINDILDIEKIETGKINFDMKWYDLPAIITEAIESNSSYAERYNIEFDVMDPILNVKVYVDKNRLLQVLSNLIANAAKFSPILGKVDIGTVDMGNQVRIYVSDHGHGIPEPNRKHIFDKYVQMEGNISPMQPESGFGLNISKAIVEQFGGKIDFETEMNKGTTFYFDLPKAQAAVVSRGREDEQDSRILICENEPDIAYLLKEILETQNLVVDVAFNASQARILVFSQEYLAIVLDLGLPDENGIQLIQDLKSQQATKNIPVIVVSANTDEGKEELECHAIDIFEWINKPIDNERLLTAIQSISLNLPKILYVEDDPDRAAFITESLRTTARVVWADSLDQARAKLASADFELVLLDLALPDGPGLELLPQLQEIEDLPVIILSATEVTSEISKQVFVNLVKSKMTSETIIVAVKQALRKQSKQTRRGAV